MDNLTPAQQVDYVLSPQQEAEFEFWRGLYEGVGPEYYYAYRVAEYFDKTRHFPSWLKQRGNGLDVGCGCISVFEGSSKQVIGVDALASKYRALIGSAYQKCNVRMQQCVGEGGTGFGWHIPRMEDKVWWIACINMIDHMPDPIGFTQELYHALADGGRLYFEVNFERGIAPPHYAVWTADSVRLVVDTVFGPPQFMHVEAVPQHNQLRYWAEYTK